LGGPEPLIRRKEERIRSDPREALPLIKGEGYPLSVKGVRCNPPSILVTTSEMVSFEE